MLHFTNKLFSATGILIHTGCQRRGCQENPHSSWQWEGEGELPECTSLRTDQESFSSHPLQQHLCCFVWTRWLLSLDTLPFAWPELRVISRQQVKHKIIPSQGCGCLWNEAGGKTPLNALAYSVPQGNPGHQVGWQGAHPSPSGACLIRAETSSSW